MSRARFVDLSVFNAAPDAIDWQEYKQWSASGDGISRLCLRSSYGTGNSLAAIRALPPDMTHGMQHLRRAMFGVTDTHFRGYRAGALAAGIDQLIFYQYAYPQLNLPQAEAAHQASVLGPIRPNDLIMLDIEENVPQATAQWCYDWLVAQQKNYPNNQIILYSFPAFIAQHLQDSRLAAFPLALASWQYSPDETPPCPSPWTSYDYIQWTDKATQIPGIPGVVDADVYVGGIAPMATSQVPTGWKDDGTTLLAPNGIAVRNGFRLFVLNNTWDPNDYPLGPEVAVAVFEMSNPGLGGGTQQMFRCSMLGWNAQLGVIHEWIGTELMAVRVALSAAQAALKDAQTQLQQCKTTLQVTGQQLQQAQAALSASPAYGVACNTISDLLKSLPRYPVTTSGITYHANEEAS